MESGTIRTGHFKKGKPHGLIKEYDEEDDREFIGEYKNGKKHGKGKEITSEMGCEQVWRKGKLISQEC